MKIGFIYILFSGNLTSLEFSGSSCNASRAHVATLSAVFFASAGGRDLNKRMPSSPCTQCGGEGKQRVPLCKQFGLTSLLSTER